MNKKLNDIAAYEEVRRIKEKQKRAEERENILKKSREAQQKTTFDKEQNALENEIMLRKLIDSLRSKDDELANAMDRIEKLEAENRAAEAMLQSARTQIKELQNAKESALNAQENERQRADALDHEITRLKRLLASSDFDRDLAEQKYNRLLTATAARQADAELLDCRRKSTAYLTSDRPDSATAH